MSCMGVDPAGRYVKVGFGKECYSPLRNKRLCPVYFAYQSSYIFSAFLAFTSSFLIVLSNFSDENPYPILLE